jgi:very-short-patch-repair endonuclease
MLSKNKRVKKLCPTCGKEFEILESRLKWGGTYCSRECHNKRGTNKIKKKCKICSKTYKIWPYQLKSKAPTCSKECTKIYLRNKYKKKVICPTCKKEFWTSKKNSLKHCSMECRNKSYIGKGMTGNYHICPTCNKKFYVEKARINRNEGIYCSKKCRDKAPNKSIEQRIKEGGLVELQCAWCSKKFIRSRYFKDIQKYCSQKCAKKSRNETIIETKVRRSLEKFKIYFEQEKTIKKPERKWNYFVDFFIPPNIIIECDGKFWHNPKKFPKSYKKDILKRKYLKKKGYRVYSLKEDEINKDVNILIKNIIKENPKVNLNNKLNPKRKPRKRTLITKICKYCGQQFETIPSREKNHHFCNQECKNNFHKIELKCQNCNNIFSIKRYQNKRKFCTIKCQKEFTKNKNKRNCLYCSNVFYPNPSDIKRGKAKFCSRECVSLYNKNSTSSLRV